MRIDSLMRGNAFRHCRRRAYTAERSCIFEAMNSGVYKGAAIAQEERQPWARAMLADLHRRYPDYAPQRTPEKNAYGRPA
ncbi:MAG: hypothetical protein HYY37_05825 [Candidatus Aenigmarchaeota archaeon]|nr:hypothetical protein [Candidatus Aenigmarchaeota archaeon]